MRKPKEAKDWSKMTRKPEMNVVDEADEMVDSDNESNDSFTDMIDADMIDTDEADDVEDEIIDTAQHEESENVEKVWRMVRYCMKLYVES